MDPITAASRTSCPPLGQAPPQRTWPVRHNLRCISSLAVRDDLRGVYAFADVVEESVRWSA